MPMGATQTNCYIIEVNGSELIIDPGMGALSWLESTLTNPKAILNTHGHFDHVWSNQVVKEQLNIPIYVPEDDNFMLLEDPLYRDTPPSEADYLVKPDETVTIDGIEITFWHYPGHTPGSSIIQIGDKLFSGDVIFERSIGRTDFPFSNPEDMKNSLRRYQQLETDYITYPGHGNETSVFKEKQNLDYWITLL
jgi:glyoxylase-like metal-dependent hydrolase (beta-lactamase superfamily II)